MKEYEYSLYDSLFYVLDYKFLITFHVLVNTNEVKNQNNWNTRALVNARTSRIIIKS